MSKMRNRALGILLGLGTAAATYTFLLDWEADSVGSGAVGVITSTVIYLLIAGPNKDSERGDPAGPPKKMSMALGNANFGYLSHL